MVPTWFVALAALPLTSSGKINRAALPAPDMHSSRGKALRAGDPLQHELIRIWEQTLDVSPIGITDSFFELGGHSLLAVAMLDRVADTFGIKPPLHALFREPTIRSLAAAIIEAGEIRDGTADASIWCIQTGEAGVTPLFLLHGDLAGGGLYCRKLVQSLDRRRPIYILPPHAPHGPQTVEAMAADMLPHIQAVWPGPYLLAGYCNGGLVAFEVAQQLRALGKQVGFLGMINLDLANSGLGWLHAMVTQGTKLLGADAAKRDWLFLRLREPLLRFGREQRMASRAAGRALLVPAAASFALNGMFRYWRRRWRRLRGLPPPVETLSAYDRRRRALPEWKSRYARLTHVGRAMAMYIPRAYPGPVTAILSQEDAATHHSDPFRNWRRITVDVDGQVVSGNHISVVTEHLDEVAEILRARLPVHGTPEIAGQFPDRARSPVP